MLEEMSLWARPTVNWSLENRCNQVPLSQITEALEDLHINMDLDHGWLIRRNNWAAALCLGVWTLTLGLWCLSGEFLAVKYENCMCIVYEFMICLHLLIFLPLSISIHV